MYVSSSSSLFCCTAHTSQLLSKDFYHTSSSAFEVKNTTPNNVAFKVTGKSTHEGATSGLVGAQC